MVIKIHQTKKEIDFRSVLFQLVTTVILLIENRLKSQKFKVSLEKS